jgi:hypothetical protein
VKSDQHESGLVLGLGFGRKATKVRTTNRKITIFPIQLCTTGSLPTLKKLYFVTDMITFSYNNILKYSLLFAIFFHIKYPFASRTMTLIKVSTSAFRGDLPPYSLVRPAGIRRTVLSPQASFHFTSIDCFTINDRSD